MNPKTGGKITRSEVLFTINSYQKCRRVKQIEGKACTWHISEQTGNCVSDGKREVCSEGVKGKVVRDWVGCVNVQVVQQHTITSRDPMIEFAYLSGLEHRNVFEIQSLELN